MLLYKLKIYEYIKYGADMELISLKKELQDKNNKVKEMYNEAKEIKKKRDEANENVKIYKKERDEINIVVKEKISEIKKLKEERAKLLEEFKEVGIGKNTIIKEIEKIELKIETAGNMSLEKERELIGKIEYYRQLQQKSLYIDELTEIINIKSKEISKLIEKSAEKHQLVVENSKNSSKYHGELMKQYDKISIAKKEADELYATIKEKKAEKEKAEKKNSRN